MSRSSLTRPPVTRRGFTLSLAGLGLAAALPLPAFAAATDLSKVVLRVADQTGATRAKLEDAGLLKDLPYQIEWSVYPAAVNLHEALKAGAADVGASADAPAVSAIAGGSKIKIAAAWETGGLTTSILVPKDSPITRLEELRGRTISPTTRGSIGHYIVIKALEKAGIDQSEVKLAFLTPTDASAAFQSGDIDAWATWTVFAARTTGRLGARTLTTGQGLFPGLSVYCATEAALADPGKRAAFAHFLDLWQQSYAWSQADEEAWVQHYARFSKQDEDLVRSLYAAEKATKPYPLGAPLVAEVQNTFETWKRAGVLSGDLNLADYILQEPLS